MKNDPAMSLTYLTSFQMFSETNKSFINIFLKKTWQDKGLDKKDN